MITSKTTAITCQSFTRAQALSRPTSIRIKKTWRLPQITSAAAKSLQNKTISTSSTPPSSIDFTTKSRAHTHARNKVITMSSPSQSNTGTSQTRKTKVLFVCLGNICRSPSAEAVFQAVVEKRGVADQYSIDSCGTGGGSSNWYLDGGFSYHEGDNADSRMTRVAATRGVRLTSLSRPLTPKDLEESDLILGMDAVNLTAIHRAGQHWQKEGKLTPEAEATWEKKVDLMTNFLKDEKFKKSFDSVPDPYYGGEKGFELVLDLLEDACDGLLDTLAASPKNS